MIESLRDGKWTSYDNLFQALNLSENHQEIISVVGGGGKTSLIRRLQRECRERGFLHSVSTTTHMSYNKDESFLGEESLESFFRVYRECGTVTLGNPVNDEKIKAPSEAFLDLLKNEGVMLLLEADGAKHLPVKIPASHEPVVRKDSTILIAVYGLDALGKTIKDYGFRPEQLAVYLEKSVTDILSIDDYVRIATTMSGGGKSKPEDCGYQVVLNKADVCKEMLTIRKMAKKISECDMVDAVHITSDLWR